MAVQEDRFAAEQVDAPEAILDVPNGCQPGRAIGPGVVGPVVLGEHAAHYIFVDLYAEGVRDVLSDFRAAEARIALFDFNNCSDEFSRWPDGISGTSKASGRSQFLVRALDSRRPSRNPQADDPRA